MLLYIHPLCYSSYKLIKGLGRTLKAKKVAVKVVDNPIYSKALRNEIVSVPYLEEEGKPLAVDPVDFGEIKQILDEGRGNIYEPWKMLARSILASGYLTTLLILHGPEQMDHILPQKFVEAALRSHVGGPHPGDVMNDQEFWERVWTRFWEKAGTVVAYNFTRHTYWALKLIGKRPTVDELYGVVANVDKSTIVRWIVSMSSLGRAGNLMDFSGIGAVKRVREVVDSALDVLRGVDVAEWIVEQEQGIIEGDIEFWKVLKELMMPE